MPAASAKSKKAGKENAAPVKSKPVEVDADDTFGDISMEEPAPKTKSTKAAAKPTKSKKADVEDEEDAGTPTALTTAGAGSADLERKLASVTAERDRLRKHRDEVSKQFEDLTRLRNTESEKLFARYKESSETAAKAQTDIITNLTTLNEKLTGRITGLEKSLASALKNTPSPPVSTAAPVEQPAPAPAPVASASGSTQSKSEQRELKALREEVAKLRSSSKEKDTKITQLEQEYQAEVANSLSLQRSTRGAPSTSTASTSQNTDDSEKDQLCLGFYEDMTECQVVDVKIKRDPKNGKEVTLNCLHTNQENSRTLQFKLRSYLEVSQELVAAKAADPWVRMIHYQPESLASETDKEFVKRLGVFADGFGIERKQLSQMWDELRAKVAGDDEDEEEE